MAKRRSRSKSGTKKRGCSVCQASGPETYQYLRETFIFDVDLARRIVLDGREPVELDEADIRYCVDNSRIHEHHVPHVDTRYPGIIAHLFHTAENGEQVHGHLLIDGNHRAARCLQLGIPYQVYLLTEAESTQVLVKAPGMECRCWRCLEAEANDASPETVTV